MLRIGIYSIVSPSQKGGVGRNVDGLINGLSLLNSNNEIYVYSDGVHGLSNQDTLSKNNFSEIRCSITAQHAFRNHLYQACVMPIRSWQKNLDVLHIPNSMPVFISIPTIVTIYDLTEFALDYRVYGHLRHAYRKFSNLIAAKRADKVITTSEIRKKTSLNT